MSAPAPAFCCRSASMSTRTFKSVEQRFVVVHCDERRRLAMFEGHREPPRVKPHCRDGAPSDPCNRDAKPTPDCIQVVILAADLPRFGMSTSRTMLLKLEVV